MIVDDNEANGRVLEEQIASWGARSAVFSSGEEAFEALRAASERGSPFHVVVADYRMPGMDGRQLAAAIKADPTLRSVAVILLTSVNGWCDAAQLRAHGLEACLLKPARRLQLYRTLTAVWARRSKTLDFHHADLGTRALPISTKERKSAGHFSPRVLIVEDNIINQKVAARMLANLGIRADMAGNGREALDRLEALSYDLILMDCQMPDMDGYEATREIRRRESGSEHIVIIALTADAMAGSREGCLEAGMDDYLNKPLRFEDLSETLQKWVSKGTPQESGPAMKVPA